MSTLHHRKNNHILHEHGVCPGEENLRQTHLTKMTEPNRIKMGAMVLVAGFAAISVIGGSLKEMGGNFNNSPAIEQSSMKHGGEMTDAMVEANKLRRLEKEVVKNEALPPIHKQTMKLIAPSHPTWTDEQVLEEFQHALQKIKDAPIIHEPFDHFFVKDLFSNRFYDALMKELPPVSTYTQARYPGTDPKYRAYHLSPDLYNRTHVHVPEQCFKKGAEDHSSPNVLENRKKAGCWLEEVQLHDLKAKTGYALTVDTDASKYPLWVQAFRLVHSRNFTHLLYSKFATDTGIPEYKQKEVAKQAANEGKEIAQLRNTAALRIEPTSYHLTPHVDRYEKLVTWQFFHPENNELEHRQVGTQFYEIKKEYQKTFELNDLLNPEWLDYKFFNRVKEQPVIPNYFFSFAPNNHSWHGAEIDPSKMEGVNKFARRTFLGFITTSYWGFHHFNKGDWAPDEFDFTASA